jgi:diacylglycerol kinase family enzyme
MDRHYHVILNSKAGTAVAQGVTPEDLEKRLQQAGLRYSIDADDAVPLEERVRMALAGPADTIVAGGGDGTVLATAEALLGTGKSLAILPLGTLNALARELKLPLEIDAAIAALPGLESRLIDVAEVNGRPFLDNVLIGAIPGIAVGRELMRGRRGLGALIGFCRFVVRRLQRARRMAVAIEIDDGQHRIERLTTLVVANNSYQQKVGAFMTRRRLDRGTLTAYIVRSLAPLDALRLAAGMFAGRWRDDEVIEYETAKTLVLRTKKKRLLVTMDGEVTLMHTPLVFAVRPLGLSVLAPPLAPEVKEAAVALEGGP